MTSGWQRSSAEFGDEGWHHLWLDGFIVAMVLSHRGSHTGSRKSSYWARHSFVSLAAAKAYGEEELPDLVRLALLTRTP
jgi:hypothetical protein